VHGQQSALHAHVQSSTETELRSIALVLDKAVRDSLEIGGIVGDHKGLESPLPAQDLVSRSGLSVAGTPFTSPTAVMMASAPASTAALNGVK
jgi:hypothetical protein